MREFDQSSGALYDEFLLISGSCNFFYANVRGICPVLLKCVLL